MSPIPVASSFLEKYWSELEVQDDDLNCVYNLLLEREIPLSTADMVSTVIEHRLGRLAQESQEAGGPAQNLYVPAERFEVGTVLVFPALGNAVGKVVGVRPGENPDLGPFDVIRVEFSGDGESREFATGLKEHKLNEPPPEPEQESDLWTVEGVLRDCGKLIETRLDERLRSTKDVVRIAGRWFPEALLAEIHVGHLNLAEAVLDVSGGGPLPTSELLKHVELERQIDPELAEFSLDYALQEDERFDEVGPAGRVLWYLRRLEPPEVQFTPPRLEYTPEAYDRSLLSADLLDLERRLDDELSQAEIPAEESSEVTVTLLFPHWRVGTLPLSASLRSLFPTAYEAPRIRFILVDGHSGEEFPGWVVRQQRYVFGLDNWYKRNEVPPGGLIRVRQAKEPGKVVIEAVDRRRRNDWVRTVSIHEDNQIGFTTLKQLVGTAYDDRMVVGITDPVALDEAWLGGKQQKLPLAQLVAYIFRELAKLNPQSAVHAQALYSGVNVFRRVPPGPIFAELVTRPYYSHVGDLYWRFDESAWRPG